MKENITVAVRIRPYFVGMDAGTQVKSTQDTVLERVQNTTVTVNGPQHFTLSGVDWGLEKRNTTTSWAFDRVFGDSSTQEQVYEAVAKPLVEYVLRDGIHATLFGYGSTGCGKTHTITGSSSNPGIAPRLLHDLFNLASADPSARVSFSFLEIYNETIIDLLGSSTARNSLDIREDDSKIVIAGLSKIPVRSYKHGMELMAQGNSNRTKAPTMANEVSSRSHSILQIHVERDEHTSVLSVIDLAGSERASATNNRGERLMEGANINRSLLALGNCINSLVSNKAKHTNFRDSKLTRLLKFSLIGKCKVVMIACISPLPVHFEETLNTLKYAKRTKNITTNVVKNFTTAMSGLTTSSQEASSAILESFPVSLDVMKRRLNIRMLQTMLSMSSADLRGTIKSRIAVLEADCESIPSRPITAPELLEYMQYQENLLLASICQLTLLDDNDREPLVLATMDSISEADESPENNIHAESANDHPPLPPFMAIISNDKENVTAASDLAHVCSENNTMAQYVSMDMTESGSIMGGGDEFFYDAPEARLSLTVEEASNIPVVVLRPPEPSVNDLPMTGLLAMSSPVKGKPGRKRMSMLPTLTSKLSTASPLRKSLATIKKAQHDFVTRGGGSSHHRASMLSLGLQKVVESLQEQDETSSSASVGAERCSVVVEPHFRVVQGEGKLPMTPKRGGRKVLMAKGSPIPTPRVTRSAMRKAGGIGKR